MPLYDFACRKCGHTCSDVRLALSEFQETLVLECPEHRKTVFDLVIRPPAVEDWGNCGDGRLFENLAPKGLRFRDKRSYKEHLRKEGLVEWSPRHRGMPGGEV